MVKISIVIPTLNEEKYLPKLFRCIENQTFKDYEVIVADADSKDNTIKIAKEFGAKVVKGGIPAVGRNNGAKKANGEYIFFFDADVKISKDFLRKAYDEMKERNFEAVTCESKPLSNLMIDKVSYKLFNIGIRLSQFLNPRALGFCILVTKSVFDETGGFDETIKIGEDYNFVKRIGKIKPFRVLDSVCIHVSIRRLKKEGRITFSCKCLQLELYRIFIGEIRKDIIKYEFGCFGDDNDKLKVLDKQLD